MEKYNLDFLEMFTEEERAFNRKMMERGLELQQQRKNPEHRGGKMSMKNQKKSGIFSDRRYDFSSEVLSEFRQKWGILE